MLKAVIFDLDDTLLKTKQTKYQALKHTAKKYYHLDLSDETIDLHWGKPFLEFMSIVFDHLEPAEEISRKYSVEVKQFANQPYEDSLEVLESLHRNYKLGIVSSASRELVLHDLKTCLIPLSLFSSIQSSEDTTAHKPNPEVFKPIHTMFAQQQIYPNHMLYVGDALTDFQAARQANMDFIGIANRTTAKADFEQEGAKTISSLHELPDVIAEKCNAEA